ncbi:MAG: DNA repair protein RecN [Kiritimatiellia bacterium]|jgi:DNA repair protein RecN (Recombination protein N)
MEQRTLRQAWAGQEPAPSLPRHAMLQQLHVKNLAIVEEVRVEFGAGLNVITGETGAGKSVLIGALGLVLGERADRNAVRAGAPEALCEAVFGLDGETVRAVDGLLAEAGVPACEDGQLIVRRVISASGSGRCVANDAAVSAQTLRRLGALLVDIHGPYEGQSLLQPDFQLDLLDAFGGCGGQRAAHEAGFRALADLRRRLDDLLGAGDVAAEIDRLQYIVDEIDSAGLSPEDEADLVQSHAEAANAEAILRAGSSVMDRLTEGEGSVFDLLASLQQLLGELGNILPEAAGWREETRQMTIQAQELSNTVADRLSRVESDATRLRQLEERMALVQRLKRKYGATIEEVLAVLDKSRARLEELASRDERAEGLRAEIAAGEAGLAKCSARLSTMRAAAAKKLASAITSELRDLGFLRACFTVETAPAPVRACGADAVSFGFAPNPGEPVRPLRAIASSGEISRVMLAAQAVLAGHDRIPVLVFDEVDSNIGGETGHVVGLKLRGVAASHQVICITHLPQVAVFGDRHFVVSKREEGERTLARIATVEGEGRSEEIARMLGGDSLTTVAYDHARALLEAVRKR